METTDDQPSTTELDADTPHDDPPTPLQPWLRRFASVAGFASAGVASPRGSQIFS